jgi:hypothetical protein
VVLPNSPLPNLRPSRVLLPSPFFLQPNLHQPCVYYGVCWQVRQNCVQDVLPTQTCAIDSIAGGRAHPKPEIWNTAQAASKPVVSPKLRLSQTCVCPKLRPCCFDMPNLRHCSPHTGHLRHKNGKDGAQAASEPKLRLRVLAQPDSVAAPEPCLPNDRENCDFLA